MSPGSAPPKATSSGILQPLVFILLLVLPPLLFAGAGIRYLLEIEGRKFLESEFDRIDRQLSRAQQISDSEYVLQAFLRRLGREIERTGISPKALVPRLQRIARQRPGLFQFTVFDEEDRFVSTVGPRGEAPSHTGKQPLSRLLEGLKRFLFEFRPAFAEKDDALLAGYLGMPRPRQLREFIRAPGWIRCSDQPVKTWFGYHLGKKLTLFTHVHQQGYRRFADLEKRLRASTKRERRLFLVDVTEKKIRPTSSSNTQRDEVFSILSRYERFPEAHFRGRGGLWSVLFLDSRHRLLGWSEDKPAEWESRLTGFFDLVLGLVFFFCSFMVFSLWYCREAHLSLRWKILGLFACSAGIPFLILGFTAATFFGERERGLQKEVEEANLETLLNIDRKFPINERFVETGFKSLLASFPPVPVDSLASTSFGALIERFNKKYLCDSFKVIDAEGRSPPGPWEIPGSLKPLKIFLLRIIRNLNGALSPEATRIVDNPGVLVDFFVGGELDKFLDTGTDFLGKLLPFNFGNSNLFILPQAVVNRSEMATHALCAIWRRQDLIRLYFRRALPFKPLENGTTLAVFYFPDQKKEFWPERTERPRSLRFRELWKTFPRRDYAPALIPLVREIRKNPRARSAVLTMKGRKILVTGTPGQLLPEALFFAVTPLDPVNAQLALLRWKLLTVAAISLAFLSYLFLLLTRKVLQPIAGIAGGVRAIQKKRFKERIPDGDPDELGETIRLFNEMMGSLLEAKMGEEVQGRFLPSGPLTLGDFTVAGRHASASQVCGDYFDFLAIDERRMVIVVGDVTGHGIPAALVMAMCKSLFADILVERGNVEEFIGHFNRVLLHIMKRSIFMTLAALEVDVSTATVRYISCGHVFPQLLSPGKPPEEIRGTGLPIGYRAKASYVPLTLLMKPGERLILYTDGLAEALFPPGGSREDNGYAELKSFLARRQVASLPETCCRCIEEHPAMARGPLPDDMTVVILERKANPE